MNNLVIGIGNTFSKVALFNNREITEQHHLDKIDKDIVAGLIANKAVDNAIISSVSQDVSQLESYLQSFCKYVRFSSLTLAGINNLYKSPGTLGLDRYAAVIGAASLYPGRNSLVVDAGTCITYDLVDTNGNYFGGSISPGVSMRYKAMNSFTGKLPLVEPDFAFNEAIGNDTRTSMLSGVQNGVAFEVKGFIDSYISKYSDLVVLICGGDVNFFDTQLKNSIFAPIVKASPDLVLVGLNEVIHKHND